VTLPFGFAAGQQVFRFIFPLLGLGILAPVEDIRSISPGVSYSALATSS
jgi:hypothetical protein